MTDEPRTPEAIVDHARLTAQGGGKPLLAEMIAVLDEEVAAKLSAMRAGVGTYGHEMFDLSDWGRKVCVMEATISFLQRIDSDPVAREYLSKRFRREVIRGGEKIPVDNSGSEPAA